MTRPDGTGAAPRRESRRGPLILESLLSGATWSETAEAVGCSRSTVARHCARPEFRQALAEARADRLRRLGDRLTDRSTRAIDLLAEAMDDPAAPWPSRVRAAAWVLRLAAQAREEGDLDARVTILEQHARAAGLRAVGGTA